MKSCATVRNTKSTVRRAACAAAACMLGAGMAAHAYEPAYIPAYEPAHESGRVMLISDASSGSAGTASGTNAGHGATVTSGGTGTAHAASNGTGGSRASDSVITTKVKAALLAKRGLRSTGIHVTTQNGAVQLNGVVPDQRQKTLALETARHIDGVTTVVDDLTVR